MTVLAANWPAARTLAAPEQHSGDHASFAKLPQITLAFWIMKIAATTLGETGGDLFSMTLKIGYVDSSIALTALLAVALAAQLIVRRSQPLLFWSVILLTSTAGTTMSDMLDRTLALGYPRGAAILIVLLMAVFTVWGLTGEPFNVAHIRTRLVELLYWTAILVSNTLGTALGDFLAHSSGLGFAGGALLVATLIASLALLALTTSFSPTLLFWAAFVLTRPLGATFGDVLTKSSADGGLGFGTVGASITLFAILAVFVARAQAGSRHSRPPG